MDVLRVARIDKTAFSVASLADESDEKQYWATKSPSERLRALELMRQIMYGYDPSTDRLQRVVEVAQSEPNGEESECLFGLVDATTHLLQSEANRKRLLAAIENIEAGRNLIEVPMDMP